MSSTSDDGEQMKAGHAPAMKVGGMRVKAPKVHGEVLTKEETESPWEGEHAAEKPAVVIVSGAVTHGNKDFPPEAIKVAHEKPMPTAIKPVPNKQINRTIHQPR